jgi:hypothetical protein
LVGHVGDSVDDLYEMVKHNIELRRNKADEYGIGFNAPSDLPLVVPKVSKTARKNAAAKAA